MEVKLHISKSPIQTLKNRYELIVEFMHGDADGETFKTMLFDANDEAAVRRMKLFIAAYEHLGDGDDFDYLSDQATEYFKSIGLSDEEAPKLGSIFGDNFYDGDITCEGRGAAFNGFELFYWNEHGVKFDVEAEIIA